MFIFINEYWEWACETQATKKGMIKYSIQFNLIYLFIVLYMAYFVCSDLRNSIDYILKALYRIKMMSIIILYMHFNVNFRAATWTILRTTIQKFGFLTLLLKKDALNWSKNVTKEL